MGCNVFLKRVASDLGNIGAALLSRGPSLWGGPTPAIGTSVRLPCSHNKPRAVGTSQDIDRGLRGINIRRTLPRPSARTDREADRNHTSRMSVSLPPFCGPPEHVVRRASKVIFRGVLLPRGFPRHSLSKRIFTGPIGAQSGLKKIFNGPLFPGKHHKLKTMIGHAPEEALAREAPG